MQQNLLNIMANVCVVFIWFHAHAVLWMVTWWRFHLFLIKQTTNGHNPRG